MTQSLIKISERCSSTIPSDNNIYSMNILQSELNNFYSKNLIFDSYNGSIYVSGIDQSQYLSGVSGGKIAFIASTSNGTYQYDNILYLMMHKVNFLVILQVVY